MSPRPQNFPSPCPSSDWTEDLSMEEEVERQELFAYLLSELLQQSSTDEDEIGLYD